MEHDKQGRPSSDGMARWNGSLERGKVERQDGIGYGRGMETFLGMIVEGGMVMGWWVRPEEWKCGMARKAEQVDDTPFHLHNLYDC